MTTTTVGAAPVYLTRLFTPEECDVMVQAGIIAADERAEALAGARRFTVDEYLAMERAGVLHEDDRIELIDGEIIIMPPIGDPHEASTDWLTRLFVPPLIGRAIVRVQGAICLNDRSAPQPDIAVLRERPLSEVGPYFPPDVHLVIEVADSSLAYDQRRQAGPVRCRRHPGGVDSQPAGARKSRPTPSPTARSTPPSEPTGPAKASAPGPSPT